MHRRLLLLASKRCWQLTSRSMPRISVRGSLERLLLHVTASGATCVRKEDGALFPMSDLRRERTPDRQIKQVADISVAATWQKLATCVDNPKTTLTFPDCMQSRSIGT